MNELSKIAVEAMGRSYSPYSGFSVGAAVRTGGGKVFSGTNVENSAYGATICAEQSAISAAVSSGEREITEISIAGPREEDTFPCGICRQIMNEFMSPDAIVRLVNPRGEEKEFRMSEILPGGFKLDVKE